MDKKSNNKQVKNGRIKGTSAFDIEQADGIKDISWSNNNSDHAEFNDVDNSNNKS